MAPTKRAWDRRAIISAASSKLRVMVSTTMEIADRHLRAAQTPRRARPRSPPRRREALARGRTGPRIDDRKDATRRHTRGAQRGRHVNRPEHDQPRRREGHIDEITDRVVLIFSQRSSPAAAAASRRARERRAIRIASRPRERPVSPRVVLPPAPRVTSAARALVLASSANGLGSYAWTQRRSRHPHGRPSSQASHPRFRSAASCGSAPAITRSATTRRALDAAAGHRSADLATLR